MRFFTRWSALLGTAALAVYLAPGLAGLLVYDRGAILGGQWWRLFTGHLVHFSPSHLLLDLAVVGLVGTAIENRRDSGMPLLLGSLPIISLALLGLQPQMSFFGGLSGLAAAQIAYLAWQGLADRGFFRWVSLGCLGALAVKITEETFTGASWLELLGEQPFEPAPLAHAVGALYGSTLAWLLWRRNRRDEALAATDFSPPDQCTS